MSFAMDLPRAFLAQVCENTREIVARRVPAALGSEGAKSCGKVKDCGSFLCP